MMVRRHPPNRHKESRGIVSMVINHLAKAIEKDSYFCQKCRKKHNRSSLGLFYRHRKFMRKHKAVLKIEDSV